MVSRNGWSIAVAGLALLFSIVALALRLPAIPPNVPVIAWFGLVLLMAGLFPLSAIAFGSLEVPGIVEQAKSDCYLLGTERTRDQRPDPSAGRWRQSSYAIHYALAIVATVLGVGLFLDKSDGLPLDNNALQAMRFGFLGAYVYCLTLIYRRYTTLDLQPHVYLYCAIGLIAGIVFNYVAFEAIAKVASAASDPPDKEFTGVGAAAAAILAFSLGYFPNLAIGWFGRLSHTAFREGQRRSDGLPLSLIDGISELHEARLRDEGIDNIQNLASANVRDLVVKTPFSAQEIVEWIDQAVLYLYLDASEIGTFRRAGARSVTDFAELWEGFCIRYEVQPDGKFKRLPIGQDPTVESDFLARRKAIAQQLQTTEERLDALYRATEHGPNMHFVQTYWNNVEAMETRARAALVRQVCGHVGCAVRASERSGAAVTEADVLRQVLGTLLSEAATRADDKASLDVTAAALYGQAWLNRLLGNVPDARRLYEQCIKEFPLDPTAFNDLAWLYLDKLQEQSLYDQAKEYASTAVGLARKSTTPSSALPGYLDTLALAHVRLKQPREALKLIKEAMEVWEVGLKLGKQHKFLKTLVCAAEEFRAQGEIEEAKVALNSVLNSGYADETTAARARKVLADLSPLPGL